MKVTLEFDLSEFTQSNTQEPTKVTKKKMLHHQSFMYY